MIFKFVPLHDNIISSQKLFPALKTPSDFLWRLIHSLSRNEKLFFKRDYKEGLSLSNHLYVQLFDAIAAQKNYDEKALLKKFTPALNANNIAFQKHYLQRQVCEALIRYEKIRDKEQEDLYRQVQLVRIFRKKGLVEEAQLVWEKAVRKARGSESFALLNLLKTEFEKMILFSNLQTPYDELHALFRNNLITYTEYAEMITMRDIYTETLLLKRKAHFDMDEELRNRISGLLEQVSGYTPYQQRRSFWYRHYLRMSRATLLYLQNRPGLSLELLQECFEEWKINSRFLLTHGEYFIELLYMINYAGILCGSYSYVTKVFNDPVSELIHEPVQHANFEAIKFLALNKICNKTARYAEVSRLLSQVKRQYIKWEAVLNADLNRTLTLSMGIGYFVLEQYDDALYFTKRGIQQFREGARDEHVAIAHLLLLLITYSMNNSRLFDSEYRSAYSYFYKRKKKHPFETALVQCLHRSFYQKDHGAKLKEYKKAMDVFRKNREDVVQQMAVSIFNYPGWLQSRAERISYRQYVERSVKQPVV